MISEMMHSPASATTSEVQRSVRFCRIEFGGEGLQDGSGNDPAVRDAEAIAEFERGAADDDLLALQPVQRSLVAAQHVDVGHPRN